MNIKNRTVKENIAAYLFLTPAMLLFLIVGLFTVVFSIIISFYNWGGVDFGNTSRFIGLRNFRYFLLGDKPLLTSVFYNSLFNNFKIGISVVLVVIPVSIVLAFLIIRAGRASGFFKIVFFIPMVASGVATYYAWMGLYEPDGVFNTVFRTLGLNFLVVESGMLGDIHTALLGVIIIVIWGSIPGTMILYYAGINSIDTSLYEAAHIDGANKFILLKDIIWPLLKPITLVAVVNLISASFQMFENVWVLTRGGPANSTCITGVLIYNASFTGYGGYGISGFGIGSAIGWTVFMVTVGLALSSMKALRTDYY